MCFSHLLAWLSAGCAGVCNRSDYRQCRDFRDGFNVSEQQGGLVCSHVHIAIESCHLCLSKVVLSLHGCNSPNLQAFLCSRQMGKRREEKKQRCCFQLSRNLTAPELNRTRAQMQLLVGGRFLVPGSFPAPSPAAAWESHHLQGCQARVIPLLVSMCCQWGA